MIVFSGKIHYGFAFLVWLLIQVQIDIWLNPIPFLIGSVFPDTDIRKSTLGKFIPLWLFFNHRGFTHTLPASLLFTAPVVFFFGIKLGVLFLLGYLLHLAMDSGTPMGINWIYGHKKRRPH